MRATSRSTSLRLAGPTASDERFSDFCHELFAGAVNGQQFAAAWAVLAALFRASGAHLLRGHAVPPEACSRTQVVHALDRQAGQMALLRGVEVADADHALFAIARFVPRGVDAVVVLRKADAFTDGERSWMALMLPHIRAALELGEQLASPLPTVATAVHFARLVPTPCVLTDEDGRCIAQNPAFGRVLEATSGAVRGGTVVFDDSFLQDSWNQALLEGRVTAATQSLLATTATGEEWKGHVVPLSCVGSPVDGAPRHLMLVMFERCTGAETRAHPVTGSSPLTRAELEVLASLLLGQTAKVIASTRGASVNTVRSQITSILGKTGYQSQKKLIASLGPNGLHAAMSMSAGARR